MTVFTPVVELLVCSCAICCPPCIQVSRYDELGLSHGASSDVPILGRPANVLVGRAPGCLICNKAISSVLHHLSPFQRIKMIPSSEWEHLLSQENCASYPHQVPLNLNSISLRSRAISATSHTAQVAKKGKSGRGS